MLYICVYLFLLKGSSKCGSPPCCLVQKFITALSFIYTMSQKTVHFYFFHNFVKCPRILIRFGR